MSVDFGLDSRGNIHAKRKTKTKTETDDSGLVGVRE